MVRAFPPLNGPLSPLPRTIPSAVNHADSPNVAINGQGAAWTTWRVISGTYRLYADAYDPGKGWSAVDDVITTTIEYLQNPANGAGATRIYAAWEHHFVADADPDVLLSIRDGAAWSDALQVNDEGDARQAYPALAIGSTGRLYAAWADFRQSANSAALYADHSLDGGATWHADVRVDDDHPPREAPAIAATGASAAHVAWASSQGDSSVIYYDRSADGGLTWGKDWLLSASEPYNTASAPDLVAAGQKVYVVWQQSDGLYWTTSTDGGATWMTPALIIASNGSLENPTLARDAAGTLHLAWVESLWTQPNEQHIGYARSLDGGVTWINRQFVDMGAPGTLRGDPDIAVNPVNGYVHLVWDDDRTGVETVFHAASADGGVTWGTPAAILEGPATEPAVAVDGDGVVFVLWQDGLEGDTDIAYSTSVDDGASWSVPGRVNDDATTFPQRQPAVVGGNSAYAVWNDFRRANWDIESASLVLACPVPLQSVAIGGPSETQTGVPVRLEAKISPATASPPLNFVWTPKPARGQGTATATYYWQEPGTYPVHVVATNCGGSVTATHRVGVVAPPKALPCVEGRVYYATTALPDVKVELIAGSSTPARGSTCSPARSCRWTWARNTTKRRKRRRTRPLRASRRVTEGDQCDLLSCCRVSPSGGRAEGCGHTTSHDGLQHNQDRGESR